MSFSPLILQYKEGKDLLYNLDFSKDPKGSLERIVKFVEGKPYLDRKLKTKEMFKVAENLEADAKEIGFVDACMKTLEREGIGYSIIGKSNIPLEGGNIYVANHPYGIPESLMMVGVLGRNLKFFARNLFALADR